MATSRVRTLRWCFAALAFWVASAALAQTELLVNGGFEVPKVRAPNRLWDTWRPSDNAALARQGFGWTIGGHSVDVVHRFWAPAADDQSLDLTGDRPGSISQTFDTQPGARYALRFKYWTLPQLPRDPPSMTMRWAPAVGGGSIVEQTYGPTGDWRIDLHWVTVELDLVASSTRTTLSFRSNATRIPSPFGVALDEASVKRKPDVPPAAAIDLTLLRVVAQAGNTALVIGRIDGAPGATVSVQASVGTACNAGLLTDPLPRQSVQVTTDANGYFATTLANVPSGRWVAARAVVPRTTPYSPCLVASGDNDTWPKALELAGSTLQASDYVDAPGKARWYRFAVQPGQRIDVRLSGLPADYDLAVFKDIGQSFVELLQASTTADVTKLSAEYAPSMFSPSMFSPSMFSPSMFSPDAYAPSMFSPDQYSPSMFSPSMFSPSMFSPSMFSPSMFSPSMFSPSMFSPSMFSPDGTGAFAPSMFSPDEIARAFSSAQTRSIVAYSATQGTADEFSIVNTWNNTGFFYVRIGGKGAAASTSAPFRLAVTRGASTCTAVTDRALSTRAPASAGNLGSVILVDGTRLALDEPLPGSGTLRAKLDTLASRVGGVVRDVGGDARVAALRAQADANPACPFAKNLLAREIKGIVDSYRASNPLRYVVIVGNDDVIPFFRYPDQGLLAPESGYVPPVQSDSASEASLRRDFVLNQDAYGARREISLRASTFPVPDLAVGRLVETPAEIAGVVDAFLALQAPIVPTSTLVTGYDFLADAANEVKAELDAGVGSAARSTSLISPNNISPRSPQAWNGDALRTALLGARHDVIFLAGHFSANSALAADFATGMVTYELTASSVDLSNAIVFSAGCHSGYSLVDRHAIGGVTWPLDWAQAFARKKATLIAGTGYQYGDTDLLEYSERLYRNFARQLRAGTGPVAVGEALVKAKLDYLATTPDVRGLHEKALLEAALFGLPMLAVDMPSGRGGGSTEGPAVATTPVTAGPGSRLGLQTATRSLTFASNERSLVLTNLGGVPATITASYLTGDAGFASHPAEPVLPLYSLNATPTNGAVVLRGLGWRGGSYTEQTLVPLTGAPTTELRGVHAPFTSPVFYPMRLATPNYFGALSDAGGGTTRVLVTPVQHRIADLASFTNTRRQYHALDLKLFYSGASGAPAVLSDAPAIVAVDATTAGPPLFNVQVTGDPAAGVQEVWVTWTTGSPGSGTWQSLDLVQCTGTPLPALCGATNDSRVWKGRLASDPGPLYYVVQAASGTGLVTLDDNFGEYYVVNAASRTATTLAFIAPPAGVPFGSAPTLTARLTTDTTAPIPGKLVTLGIGPNAQTGVTDAGGNVSVTLPTAAVPGSYALTAAFGGDVMFKPTSAATSFAVQRAPTTLSATAPIGAALTAALGTKTQQLAHETVEFTVSGPRYAGPAFAITDYVGQAVLPVAGLPAGAYTVSAARYAGSTTYAPTTVALAQNFVVPQRPQAIVFDLPLPNRTLGSPPFVVHAAASSGLPVTFATTVGSTCSVVNGPAGQGTVTLTGVGSCGLVASQPGDADWLAAIDVTRTFAITGAGGGAFTSAGSMNVARWAHTATLLYDGRVLIVGGFNASGVRLNSYEIYTPSTGVFSGPFALPLGMAVGGHTATRLANVAGDGSTGTPVYGSVLLTGGGASPSALNTAWFNPLTSAWTVYPSAVPEHDRRNHTATLLHDGRVLLAGGAGGFEIILPFSSTSLFDPTRNPPLVELGPFMPGAREMHAATDAGIRVLLSGGRDAFNTALSSLLTYEPGDLVSDPFNRIGTFVGSPLTMTTPRLQHGAASRLSSFALIGGSDTGGPPPAGATASVECGSAVPPHTTAPCLGGLVQGRRAFATTLLTDLSILVTGGVTGVSTRLASTERSAPPSGSFAAGPSLAVARSNHQATLLLDGRVLVTGGLDASGTPTASAELFSDPSLGGFTPPDPPVYTIANADPTRYSPHTGPVPATFRLWVSGDRPTGEVTLRLNTPDGPDVAGCTNLLLAPATSSVTCTPSPALTYGSYTFFIVYMPADTRNAPSATPFGLHVADWSRIDFRLVPEAEPTVGVPATLWARLFYADANTGEFSDPIFPGLINFYDNYVPIAGCQNVPVNSDSVAECVHTFTTTGTRYIRAEYNGTEQIRASATEFPVTPQPD